MDLCESSDATVLVNTVVYNKTKCSNDDYTRVVNTRKLQSIIDNPSFAHCKSLITKQQLLNCPVTVADIEAAGDIFGPSIKFLKGKTTQQKVKQVKTSLIPLPIKL